MDTVTVVVKCELCLKVSNKEYTRDQFFDPPVHQCLHCRRKYVASIDSGEWVLDGGVRVTYAGGAMASDSI